MTLIDFLNKALKRATQIKGDAGQLTGLTDSARQMEIDIMIQATNETLNELFNALDESAGEINGTTPMKEGTITLDQAAREYTLPGDFESFVTTTLLNEANGYWIKPYAGGYVKMRNDQTQPSQYTGRPLFWAINPENGKLRLDQQPQASDDGLIYRFTYRNTVNLTDKDDILPVSEGAANRLVPAVVQVWNRERKDTFDAELYFNALAGAVRLQRQTPDRRRYA